MASILRVNTLTDASSGNSTAMSVINQGTAKCWVNFNGTGTIAARDSFNVGSLTDNGTGDYSVNYSNAMADDDFSMVGTSCFATNDTWVQNGQGQTTSLADVNVTVGGSLRDAAHISINIHGDLA